MRTFLLTNIQNKCGKNRHHRKKTSSQLTHKWMKMTWAFEWFTNQVISESNYIDLIINQRHRRLFPILFIFNMQNKLNTKRMKCRIESRILYWCHFFFASLLFDKAHSIEFIIEEALNLSNLNKREFMCNHQRNSHLLQYNEFQCKMNHSRNEMICANDWTTLQSANRWNEISILKKKSRNIIFQKKRHSILIAFDFNFIGRAWLALSISTDKHTIDAQQSPIQTMKINK